MTTALPAQATPHDQPLSDARHLRLVGDSARSAAEGHASAPLVGYLVLVPEGTDLTELFVKDRPRPEIRPVVTTDSIRVRQTADEAASIEAAPIEAVHLDTVPAEASRADAIRADTAHTDAIRVDPARHVAEVDGRELDLTYLEFELLAHLVLHPDHVHSRDRLVTAVWGYDHIGDGRTVDVHIARLRRKLGEAHRHRIVTVRRVGYKYVPDRRESPNAALCGRP